MKVKVLTALALFAAIAAVNAANYVVYKTTDQYSYYSKTGFGPNSKTPKAGKAEKVKILTYTVIDQANFDNNDFVEKEDPQRIVLIQGKDAKGMVSASTDLPKAKKFFIDPSALDQYKGDDVYEAFKMWSGDWPVAMFIVNNSYVITDFDTVVSATGFAEVGQTYVGAAKNGVIRQLKGSSLIDQGTITTSGIEANVFVGSKGSMKYDKKLTALTASEKTIEEAVAAVTEYLTTKKYASTWK